MNCSLLTIEDLMNLLRVSRTTLRDMRLRGELPAELKTRSVRWNAREIEKWISKHSKALNHN